VDFYNIEVGCLTIFPLRLSLSFLTQFGFGRPGLAADGRSSFVWNHGWLRCAGAENSQIAMFRSGTVCRTVSTQDATAPIVYIYFCVAVSKWRYIENSWHRRSYTAVSLGYHFGGIAYRWRSIQRSISLVNSALSTPL
jgi:hypothetical protein